VLKDVEALVATALPAQEREAQGVAATGRKPRSTHTEHVGRADPLHRPSWEAPNPSAGERSPGLLKLEEPVKLVENMCARVRVRGAERTAMRLAWG
jgi:hypothetical protein